MNGDRDREDLARLRDTLSNLYRGRADAERVVSDAGLDLDRLDLDGGAKNRWHRIVDEADKQKRVGALVSVALNDYPHDEVLLALAGRPAPAPAPALAPVAARAAPAPFPAAPAAPEGAAVPKGPVDFFVSYTQADRAWAEWIAWVLEEAGWTCILQAWDFAPGRSFVQAMHDALIRARRVLTVLSPDYFRSGFATPEWQHAFARDPRGEAGTLLPVRVRDVDPPGLAAPIGYVDVFGKDEATAITLLLSAARGERGKPAARPDFPGR